MRKASKGMKYTRHRGGVCSLRSADRCKDIEIIIPEQVLFKGKVIEIDEYAFSNLSFITKVVIPEGVVSIGEYAFENCKNLELVVLPQSLKSIGSGAFMHCKKLKSIELPPLVTSISDKTFAHCCALEHIDLRHISFIGESAFAGCDSLGDVAISDALKEVHATSFVAANIIRIVYNGKTA